MGISYEECMRQRKDIDELCNALGVSVSVSSYSWDDRSIEFTITAPIRPGINSGMRAEEYVYATLTGIYQYQKRFPQTEKETSITDPPKKVSRLANLLKRHK